MPTAPKVFGSTNREKRRGTKQQRGYGGAWERISKMVRAQYPVCQICHDAPSDDVDHIIPFNGPNDPLRTQRSNLQAVCRACHVKKTREQR
jgi:5-methylcytosine-specific restriction endonuclease McrA